MFKISLQQTRATITKQSCNIVQGFRTEKLTSSQVSKGIISLISPRLGRLITDIGPKCVNQMKMRHSRTVTTTRQRAWNHVLHHFSWSSTSQEVARIMPRHRQLMTRLTQISKRLLIVVVIEVWLKRLCSFSHRTQNVFITNRVLGQKQDGSVFWHFQRKRYRQVPPRTNFTCFKTHISHPREICCDKSWAEMFICTQKMTKVRIFSAALTPLLDTTGDKNKDETGSE